MKTKFIYIMALMALASCSNKKTATAAAEESTPTSNTETPVTPTTAPFVESLSLNASSFSISTNSTTEVYANGGAGSYFYYISSGAGSINSSTGLFTASATAGSVEIGVEDANGSTAFLIVDVVADSGGGSGGTCGGVVLQSPSVLHSDSGVQNSIDLARYSYLSGFVLTGIGLRFTKNSATGIYTRVSEFTSEGSVNSSNSYAYVVGDLGPTDKGEIYVQLPANYFIVGVGAATTENGSDVEALKVYGAKVDSFGLVTATLECLVDRSGGSGCAISKSIRSSLSARYKEFRGMSTRALTGFGMGLSSNKVNALWAKGSNIKGDASSCGF